MSKKERRKTVTLIKHFKNWPDKIIYQGTLRKAKNMIPPSKKNQFSIDYKKG